MNFTKSSVKIPFFDSFKCRGASCPVSCCSGLRIALPRGEEKDLPREDWTTDEQGVCISMRPNGDCPFWTENHRCQRQRGDDQTALPTICRFFPRIVNVYSDRAEYSLDTLCPEVCRLVATWEIGDVCVDGDAEFADPQYRRRAEEMESYRTLELPGVAPSVADFLRRFGAYLLFVQYPAYAADPRAQGVFAPVRRFIVQTAESVRTFAALDEEFFAFICRAWRAFCGEYGFDADCEGNFGPRETQ